MISTIKIGKIIKTHGFKGNLKAYIEPIFINQLKNIKCIFIHNIPYFIENIDIELQSITLKLEDINNKEEAQLLLSSEIFVEKSLLDKLGQKANENLIGYQVFNRELIIGEVIEKISMPSQELINVRIKDKEILIPINHEYVLSIDDNLKQIVLNLPENYIETFI